MPEGHFYEFGPFRVDIRERLLLRAGTPVLLTPKAFDTLIVLLQNRGRLVTKEELLRQVWPDTFVEEGNLTFNISSLRKALGQRDTDAYIKTVARHGYRFVAETKDRVFAPQLPVRRSVGRALDRADLASALEVVRRGTGRLVCVTGEPGIGKTTLIEGFLEDLRTVDPRVPIGRGRCSERLAGTGAYLPLLEALQTLSDGPDGADSRRALATSAPSWYAQIVPRRIEPGAPAVGAAAPSQERLKWELGAFFRDIGNSGPVVLFLDDVQWADTSTVDVLAYLAGKFDLLRLLVLVAYRSSEMLLAQRPFSAIKLDLQGRGRCRELALGLLTRGDLDDYLAFEFPGHRFPEAFRSVIHAKTEGNALFMVDLLRYLRDRGVVGQTDEGWTLVQPVPALERELPESTRSVIQRTIEQLDAADRRLLTAASVAGTEFLSSVAAHAAGFDLVDAEERLERLERIHGLVRRVREEELPDRTLGVRYRFVHVLYQDALYGSLTAGRKVSLSSAVAAALEAHYGEWNSDIAPEVALLLSVARDFSRAVEWFLLGAQRALRVFANHEAIALARRGLEMLDVAVEMPQRDRQEMLLQTVLGLATQAVQGFAAPDVESAYRRALMLAQASSHHVQLFPVLSGLWLYYTIRGELHTAHDLATELLRLSCSDGDEALRIQAHQAMGGTLMDLGRLDEASEHFERAIAAYETSPRTRADVYVVDPGVGCRAFAARVLWPLGYPDRALARADAALSHARRLSHPQSLALALTFAAITHHFRGEVEQTLERAEEAGALSREHGLVQTLAWAALWHGWAVVRQGRGEEGVAEMRDGLRAYRAMGSEISRPQFLALLAEALGAHGRGDEDIALLNEALSIVETTNERYYEAEIHRVRGRLLAMRASASAKEEAEASVRRALEIARLQHARGWELRAAIELCQLPGSRRISSERRAALEQAYSLFTEGFDTADLRDARGLLDNCRGQSTNGSTERRP